MIRSCRSSSNPHWVWGQSWLHVTTLPLSVFIHLHILKTHSFLACISQNVSSKSVFSRQTAADERLIRSRIHIFQPLSSIHVSGIWFDLVERVLISTLMLPGYKNNPQPLKKKWQSREIRGRKEWKLPLAMFWYFWGYFLSATWFVWMCVSLGWYHSFCVYGTTCAVWYVPSHFQCPIF